jgi:large subunit ribosomal protein L30
MTKIAIIRLKGRVGVNVRVKTALQMFKLDHNNQCLILEEGPNTLGMLRKAKDYITWGPINDETLKTLVEKRGKGKEHKIFNLSPPRGGLGRKGIKATFVNSGALGNRGEKINDLLKRMI